MQSLRVTLFCRIPVSSHRETHTYTYTHSSCLFLTHTKPFGNKLRRNVDLLLFAITKVLCSSVELLKERVPLYVFSLGTDLTLPFSSPFRLDRRILLSFYQTTLHCRTKSLKENKLYLHFYLQTVTKPNLLYYFRLTLLVPRTGRHTKPLTVKGSQKTFCRG